MPLNKLNPQEKQADLIQRYLSGELTNDENKEIETKIKSDPNFAEDVRVYRSILGNMKAIRSEAMAEKLDQWYREHPFSKEKNQNLWLNHSYYYIAAASIFLVLLFGYWISNKNHSTPTLSAEALYTEAFFVYPAEEKLRALDDTIPLTNLEKGLTYYNSFQYEPAIKALLRALEDPKTSTYYRLFLGIAYLETNEPDLAIVEFEALIDPPNKIYGETARWYLAMAYLKKGDKNTAELVLKEITSHSRHYHKEEAEILLKKF